MNLISIKDTVKEILEKEPITRDNDHLLILKVWATQNPRLRDHRATFWDFATGFKSGRYATPESVTRCRRKYQEKYPNLRGKNYQARQGEQENVKQQIKTMA